MSSINIPNDLTYYIQFVCTYIYTFIVLHYSEALGLDCDVNQEVLFGGVKVITFTGSASFNISCNEMTFRSTDQHMLCIRHNIFNDPDCALNLTYTDTKYGQVINEQLSVLWLPLTKVYLYVL